MGRTQVYLCGGMGKFGKERFDESNEWRIYYQEKFLYDWPNWLVCNPNDHFNFLYETDYESNREIMDLDLHKVRNSDLIIVNFNDPNSIGSAMELAIAYEKRIPILGLCENGEEQELHPWLKEVCTRIFTNREELFLYAVKHYSKGRRW